MTRHRTFSRLAFWGLAAAVTLGACLLSAGPTHAQSMFPVKINVGLDQAKSPQDTVMLLQIVALLTVLTLAPSIVMLMTSFTRIVIIFSFLRKAIGTQSEPPNQVLIGLSLFLTFFLMAPVFQEINRTALDPFLKGKMQQEEALTTAMHHMRTFMLHHTRDKELGFFMSAAKLPRPNTQEDVPTYLLVPAFVLSELKTSFQIGFVLYLPFLLIDMVIASVLMSMGMMMLPPVMISMPFKILMFVLVDGWFLVTKSIITSY